MHKVTKFVKNQETGQHDRVYQHFDPPVFEHPFEVKASEEWYLNEFLRGEVSDDREGITQSCINSGIMTRIDFQDAQPYNMNGDTIRFWNRTDEGRMLAGKHPKLSFWGMDSISKCSFGDFNNDGIMDIVYERSVESEEDRHPATFMMLGSDIYQNLPGNITLSSKYKGFLASPFSRLTGVMPQRSLELMAEAAAAIEARNIPDRELNLLLGEILHPLDVPTSLQRNGSGLKWLNLYGLTIKKFFSHDNYQELVGSFRQLDRAYSVANAGVNDASKNKNVHNPYRNRLDPVALMEAVHSFSTKITDGGKLRQALDILTFLTSADELTPYDFSMFYAVVERLAVKLSDAELALFYRELRRKFTDDISRAKIPTIAKELSDIVFYSEPADYFKKAYEWASGDEPEFDHTLLEKYKFLLLDKNPPAYEDIAYADEKLGAEKTHLLYERFNITYFYRYSENVLGHLVEMAKDPNYKRDLPLLFAIVAKTDYPDMFRWGRGFEYDPRIRVVVVEVGSRNEYYRYSKWVKRRYGNPSILFQTSHGMRYAALLGPMRNPDASISLKNEDEFRERIRGIYGDEPPKQIVINACSTGSSTADYGPSSDWLKGKSNQPNLAQMFADAFGTDVYAAEGREALWDFNIEVKNGAVFLYPYFIEWGDGSWGTNFGGTRFRPSKR